MISAPCTGASRSRSGGLHAHELALFVRQKPAIRGAGLQRRGEVFFPAPAPEGAPQHRHTAHAPHASAEQQRRPRAGRNGLRSERRRMKDCRGPGGQRPTALFQPLLDARPLGFEERQFALVFTQRPRRRLFGFGDPRLGREFALQVVFRSLRLAPGATQGFQQQLSAASSATSLANCCKRVCTSCRAG
jgi:hypothetical protein